VKPFIVRAEDARRYTFGEHVCDVVSMPEENGIGGFAVETSPVGFASPLHVHHRDDGVFYILEGAIRIQCGDLNAVAVPGSTVFLPRGIPHAFRVEGDVPLKWLNLQAPHGDFMLRAMGQGAEIEQLGPPPF
jgi:mannose-6-phosphate isomerase-like protein (cupin superfamily)